MSPRIDHENRNTEVHDNPTNCVLAKKNQTLNNGMTYSIHLPVANFWYNTHSNYSLLEEKKNKKTKNHSLASQVG